MENRNKSVNQEEVQKEEAVTPKDKKELVKTQLPKLEITQTKTITMTGPKIYFFDDTKSNTDMFIRLMKGQKGSKEQKKINPKIAFIKSGMKKHVFASVVMTHNKTMDALKDPMLLKALGYDMIFMDRQHGGEINMLSKNYVKASSLKDLLPENPTESNGEKFTKFLRGIPGNENLIVQLYTNDSEFKEGIPEKLATLNSPTFLFNGITYKAGTIVDEVVSAFNQHKPNGWTATLVEHLKKPSSSKLPASSPDTGEELDDSSRTPKEEASPKDLDPSGSPLPSVSSSPDTTFGSSSGRVSPKSTVRVSPFSTKKAT